jgi:phosphate-selective porin OprO/OprP
MKTPPGSVGVALLALVIFSASPAAAQDQSSDDNESWLRWRNRPSLQFGDVRIDIRLKFAHEWRGFDPDLDEANDVWRVRRGGFNGEIGDHFDFEIEHDTFSDGDWRDVFLNWSTYRQIEIKGGRFKVPFGYETNTSITSIDFAARSLASSTITPSRDTGGMVHGRFLQRGITYEFGVFRDDGDNSQLRDDEQFTVSGEVEGIGPSFAGRITATPLRPLAETFERLRVGFALGGSDLPEGLNSFRGESLYGTVDFFEPVYVKGRRTRMGVEFVYTPGPVGVTAEWMQAREQRKNQGLGDVDLSDLITTGWYVSGTWLVTGEDKEDFDNPRNPLFDGGIGAIEIAARYEQLGFESADKSGPAFTNPRAEHILGNTDSIWTIGLNWFINRWVRTTVNAVREEFDDANRTPLPGTSVFWSGVGRLQLVF